MASSCSIKCILVTTILCYISGVRTEVPAYCLQPLNTSDCGGTPIAVMTYWKPGSRCELDTWRGCPTINKFPDEYNCSATCIFRPYISEIFLDDEANEWEGKLEKMDMEELKHVSSILDTVAIDTGMNENIEEKAVPLKQPIAMKIETTTPEGPVVEQAVTDPKQESIEEGTTEPSATKEITTEQSTTKLSTTEHITTEHATTESATTEHVTTEPATTEPTTTEHATTEHDTTEHATTEHVTTEPATTEPATTEHATTEHATTVHDTTEHATTEHDTTEHATTEHDTTEHATTEHNTTEQAAVETNGTTVKVQESSEGDSDEIDVVTTY